MLGFDELDMMTEDRHRLVFSCVHWEQFIFLIAEDDPMQLPRASTTTASRVGTRDELDAAWERAVAFREQIRGSTSSTRRSTTRAW